MSELPNAVPVEIDTDALEEIALDLGGEPGAGEALLIQYTKLVGRYRDERQRLEDAHERLVADVDAKLKALEWKLGTQVYLTVQAMLAGTKKRHVKTPYGRVGFRKDPARVLVNDPAELLADEKWSPLIERKPSMKAILEYVLETGETPPGVVYEPSKDRLYAQ